jgi:hypothetical protein
MSRRASFIEAEAMAQARAAVVAGEEEALVSEALHHLEHVLGHDAEAVVDEIGAGLGERTVAIAAQVGEHDVVALRKPRRHRVPQHVIIGIAVEHQQRRAGAAVAHANDRALGADVEMLESREQGRDLGAAPARGVAGIIGRRRFGEHVLRRLVRQRRRGDAGRRCARGDRLHQTAAAQAFLDRLGWKWRGHSCLPVLFRPSDA